MIDMCDDASVSCHRFFDVPGVINLGSQPLNVADQNYINGIDDTQHDGAGIRNPFVGCISNLTLDGKLIDFSNFEELEKVGSVQHGCKQKRNDCDTNPCHPNTICVTAWDGYHCQCKRMTHTGEPCMADAENLFINLYDEESFVFWNIPSGYMKFRTLSFEFRTRLREAQIIAVEFSKRSQFIIFSISHGKGLINIGSKQYSLSFPNFGDGNLRMFDFVVENHTVIIIIDRLYKKHIPMENNLLYWKIRKIYSGLAPSTSYPQRFEGCIRNVYVNDMELELAENMMTKPGCQVPNACSSPDACPTHSTCVRKWDRHSCKCYPGFIGDGCVDICLLSNLCGEQGICLRANNSRGYECRCKPGLSGQNCERKTAEQICPKGWYGAFPKCKRCSCDIKRNFDKQCHTKTGECFCKSATYYSENECIPCECGYGSSNSNCSSSGQCQCTGESVGRRCDRCSNFDEVLDRNTLKCLKIRNKCPSNIEYGVQWPTTIVGATARQSCPNGEEGLVLRKCLKPSYWDKVNSYNCTIPAFNKISTLFLQSLLDANNRITLAQSLSNETNRVLHLKGVNVAIARQVLEYLVKDELQGDKSPKSHLKSAEYTDYLLKIADILLGINDYTQNAALVHLFNNYGIYLAHLHRNHSYLSPFIFYGENIVFAVDDMYSREDHIFPKFNNFIDQRKDNFRNIEIRVLCQDGIAYSENVVSYSMYYNNNHFYSEAPIVVLYHNGTCPIQVLFPINEETWRYPECVIAEKIKGSGKQSKPVINWLNGNIVKTSYSVLEWSGRNAVLAGLNRTHAICNFEHSGIYTILIQPDHGALIRFLPSKAIPYAEPLCVTFALVLLLLSAIRTLYRPCLHLRLIRFGFILMFMLDIIAIFLVHRLQLNSVFCLARNTIISLCNSAVFAWLFMYSFHIYQLLATGRPQSNYWIIILCSLVTPALSSLISFFFTPQCSLSPSQQLFWVLLVPDAFFVLSDFYAFLTALLISFNRQFDYIVSQYSIRTTLYLHIILTLLCASYNSLSLFVLRNHDDHLLYKVALNSLLVFVATYIFIWTNYFASKQSVRYDNGLWMSNLQKTADEVLDPHCQTPLLLQSSNAGLELQ
ncbi:unnamed protein product [Thelazia callipaeda]|uniref:EGF-like domain-containing protein n=1 Tax=Thelazia callipaeda TaxID=103827 RepID=A0A0N5DBJ6_THECL|nr:unnamed protein product [Thelazia callipaeda]